mmetsp:Transcript_5553/g.19100  ORF Transcript_5553/g.19100 Transcript_5553/m.19100 type:complete len:645 (-) Transcript_5553:85-2019(-)
MSAPKTAEEAERSLTVGVKEQYLKGRAAEAAAAGESTGAGNDATEDSGAAAAAPAPPPVVNKYKSKKQEKRERQASKLTSLCTLFARGDCSYGDKCRFSHDVALYLASKPADLPGQCPWAASTDSSCPYGLGCRFLKSHLSLLSPELRALAEAAHPVPALDPAPEVLPPLTSIEAELGALDKEVQHRLRKNTYTFPAAKRILDELSRAPFAPSFAPSADGAEAAARDEAEREPDAAAAEEEDEDAEAEQGERKRRRIVEEGEGAEGTEAKLRPEEVKLVDFRGKLYLAPLTTTGNLPFRRICKRLGADITCGEMAMATNLLQGQASEWALLRRHPCEDIFGVQICGGYVDSLSRCAELLSDHADCTFVDLNMGCPIDIVCNRGAGSMLLTKLPRVERILRSMAPVLQKPLTIKLRTGYSDVEAKRVAHELLPKIRGWGISAATLHGRSRQQRYSRLADWDYIERCAEAAPGLQLVGNGDVFNFNDYVEHMESGRLATTMIARGALIKPWLFTEIKERRHWDISATERFDLLKSFCAFGLEHWGSDTKGVENTRRFLLEWLSFLHRYVPVGLLEVVPQRLHHRVPEYFGRSDLETLLGSTEPKDWIEITSRLLGPPPASFSFRPKHKSNSAAANSEGGMALAVNG